jgi:hypothetical protein
MARIPEQAGDSRRLAVRCTGSFTVGAVGGLAGDSSIQLLLSAGQKYAPQPLQLLSGRPANVLPW